MLSGAAREPALLNSYHQRIYLSDAGVDFFETALVTV
jgi:hypothetical protein